MATTSALQAVGLYTFSNLLSLPPGALLEALNVVIDRPGIIEPRRGFGDYGDSFPNPNDRAKQLLVYKSRILRHYFDNTSSTNKIQFDNGSGSFTSFDGIYNETETGLRIKGLEANGNFYFTTDSGIKKISALTASNFSSSVDYITDAGGVGALDLTATINYTTSGFFTADSVIAYKTVWGIRDNNNNLILGSSSPSTPVYNTSMTQNAVVDLRITVPDRINTTDYFYQLYRTAVVAGSTSSPSEEFYLVYEANVTEDEITDGEVLITDITPDDFRAGGALLYTNPVSGEGEDQSNFEPPIAKDISLFRGSVFYANTRTKHRLFLNLLSLTDFISDTSKLIISTGATTNEYIFRGQEAINEIQTVADVAGSLNNTYFFINSANNSRRYYVWFNVSGGGTDPEISGRIGVEVTISTGDTANAVAAALNTAINGIDDFTSTVLLDEVTISNSNNGFSDEPTDDGATGFALTVLQIGKGETLKGDITLIDDTNPAQITSIDHNLETGDEIIISNSNSSPTVDGTFTVTVIDKDIFTVPVNLSGQTAGNTGNWIESQNYVLLSGLPTVGQQVDETSRSLIHIINANDNEVVYGRYLSGPTSVPGEILLESRSLEDITFFLAVNNANLSNKWNPELPIITVESNIGNISAADPTILTTSTNHNLVTGDQIVIYNSDSIPSVDGVHTVTVLSATTFSIPVGVSTAGDNFTWFEALEGSDNEIAPNRIYFSKYQQPEAVPLVNFIDVGPKDKEIKRILALRDSLFILKEDGVYKLSGLSAPNFSVALFDGSAKIEAADTAVTLNNQIYGLFDSGICQISDTGINVISKPIDDLISDVTTSDFESAPTASFGVSYESDDAYILWLPTIMTDEVATQCYRYNVYTNSWTRWERSDICGIVNDDKKLYLGLSDRSYIQQERKSNTRRDYADRELSREIPLFGIDETTIELTSLADVDIGDVLLQTQYLTIAQFNRTLKQLDLDQTVNDSDYFLSLQAIAGDNMRNKVNALASKLDADTGVNDTDYLSLLTGTNTFEVIQDDYNLIIQKLNLDIGVFLSDYDESEGTTVYEMQITEVSNGNTVTIRFETPFINGPVSIFKGIPTTVLYAPQHFGEPSVYKQVRGGAMLFERNTFTTAVLSFSSDLSSVFDEIPFENPGAGIWGLFNWGEQTWGGNGAAIPFRTLIPLQKQRCRFLNVKFEHTNAFEKYAITGVSFTPRVFSPEERSYRG